MYNVTLTQNVIPFRRAAWCVRYSGSEICCKLQRQVWCNCERDSANSRRQYIFVGYAVTHLVEALHYKPEGRGTIPHVVVGMFY